MKSCKESVLLKRRKYYTFSHTTGSHAKPNHATRKSGQSHKPCDLYPRTLAPRLPDVCEKNVFCFFRASASGKQHITCSITYTRGFVCLQPWKQPIIKYSILWLLKRRRRNNYFNNYCLVVNGKVMWMKESWSYQVSTH